MVRGSNIWGQTGKVEGYTIDACMDMVQFSGPSASSPTQTPMHASSSHYAVCICQEALYLEAVISERILTVSLGRQH